MNPSIFVSVSTEPGLSTAERESIRYDHFVTKLLKPFPENFSALHIGLGLAGELCEVIEDGADIIEECGDYEFYFQALLNHYGLTIYDCVGYYEGTIKFSTFIVATGQLIDCIKREYVYNKARELPKLKENIWSIYRFLINQYDRIDMTRQEVLQANALKLERRYAGLHYSDEAANARADKTPGQD